MDFSSAVYSYQFSGVKAAGLPGGGELAIMAAFVVAVGIAWFVGPYAYGYFTYLRKEREKRQKKQKLLNFATMRDLQTELEEEIKKSLTNANLS